MQLTVRSFLIGVLFALLSMSVQADDAIAIRYLYGHPLPNRSSETMNLNV